MKIFTATQKLRNCATTYLSLRSVNQNVRLKQAISRRSFFWVSAASGTLHEDLHTFYCCWTYKFVISTFLCNNPYFYIIESDIAQQCTQNALLRFHSKNGYANAPQCYVTRTSPIFFMFITYSEEIAEGSRRLKLPDFKTIGTWRW